MSAPLAPLIAAPLVDFFSWGLDAVGKLLREEANEEQTLAEMERRRAECMAEIERGRAKTVSDRAVLDADADKKFGALSAPTPGPTSPDRRPEDS